MPNWLDLQVGGIYPTASGALCNQLQVATGPGQLFYWSIGNASGSAAGLYLLIDYANGTTPPNNGTVSPLDWMYVASTSSGTTTTSRSYAPVPLYFKNGLWIMASSNLTSPYTLTVQTTTVTCISAMMVQNG